MRFIHAADIHIDSPLIGLNAYQDAPAERLRNATRDAFTQLVDRAIEERVDFIVIAGDLYDGEWKDFRTGLYFIAQMARLAKAGITAYVLFGNHDAESEMTLKLKMPLNVRLFGSKKAETLLDDQLRVALHGHSFKTKAVTENLVHGYGAPVPGYFNIGVLHTALEGNVEHPNYAPCTLDQLHAKGYDYWALGHVHEHQVWTGASTIVFPGNLQGRHIRETGRRGAVLVTVDDDHKITVERLHIDVLRWEHVRVDVSSCNTLDEVSDAIQQRLFALAEEDAVPRAVRVTVFGASPAHGELFSLEGNLRAAVLATIAIIDNDRLWLEKVKVDTTPVEAAGGAVGHADAMFELSELLNEADQDPELATSLRELLQQLHSKAPDLATQIPALRAVTEDGTVTQLLKDVGPALLARLARE